MKTKREILDLLKFGSQKAWLPHEMMSPTQAWLAWSTLEDIKRGDLGAATVTAEMFAENKIRSLPGHCRKQWTVGEFRAALDEAERG